MASVNPVKKLRGTTSQNAAVTLEEGTIVYTTDDKKLYVHDGSMAGGKGVTMDDEWISGSNSNGKYIKFPDGTMICREEKTHYDSSTAPQIITFPAEFDSVPHVVFMQKRDTLYFI